MSDQKPPDSITEALINNPQQFLTPEQRQAALDATKDAAEALKPLLQGQPVHVGDEQSGQLAPPDNPLLDTAAGMKPAASITEAILSNPNAFLTPEQQPDGPPPQPMGKAVAAAAEVVAVLKAMLLGEPVQVGNEQSGQLRPPDDHSFER